MLIQSGPAALSLQPARRAARSSREAALVVAVHSEALDEDRYASEEPRSGASGNSV
jgi:hypothetical protein